MIASIFNFSHETGSCFAPRISFVYAAILAAVITIVYQNRIVLSAPILIGIGICLLGMQYWSLTYVRKYNYFQNSFALLAGNNKSEDERSKILIMKKLSMGLEKDFPVEVPFKYFKAFDKQDICFPERSYNAFKSPRLIIAEKNSTEKASIPYPGMKKSENKYFIFYFAEDAFNEKIIEVLED